MLFIYVFIYLFCLFEIGSHCIALFGLEITSRPKLASASPEPPQRYESVCLFYFNCIVILTPCWITCYSFKDLPSSMLGSLPGFFSGSFKVRLNFLRLLHTLLCVMFFSLGAWPKTSSTADNIGTPLSLTWGSLCHSLGSEVLGSWHGCAHVNNTYSLRASSPTPWTVHIGKDSLLNRLDVNLIFSLLYKVNISWIFRM